MSVASCPLATLSLAYADYDLSASLLILSILWIVWLIFSYSPSLFFFFLNDPAPPEIYPLSLPDALPIWPPRPVPRARRAAQSRSEAVARAGDAARAGAAAPAPGRAGGRHDQAGEGEDCRAPADDRGRSEEHTSELQSLAYLVCRLLLEKK